MYHHIVRSLFRLSFRINKTASGFVRRSLCFFLSVSLYPFFSPGEIFHECFVQCFNFSPTFIRPLNNILQFCSISDTTAKALFRLSFAQVIQKFYCCTSNMKINFAERHFPLKHCEITNFNIYVEKKFLSQYLFKLFKKYIKNNIIRV